MGSFLGSGREAGEGDGNPLLLAWRIPWTEGLGNYSI